MMPGGSEGPRTLPIYGAAASDDLEELPDEDGWVRRYLAEPEKAEEARRMYEELGFEVELRRPDPAEMSEECGDCRVAVCTTYFLIFTKRRVK